MDGRADEMVTGDDAVIVGEDRKIAEFIAIHEVCKIATASKCTIYRWMRMGMFPRPRKFGDKMRRWKRSEVVAWRDSRPASQ